MVMQIVLLKNKLRDYYRLMFSLGGEDLQEDGRKVGGGASCITSGSKKRVMLCVSSITLLGFR